MCLKDERWSQVGDTTAGPSPVAEQWEWQFDGLCRTVSPELFFHPESERGAARRNRDLAAKAVCAGCPVLATCRAHGLTVREPYGVWGGLSEDDREAIYLARRTGRLAEAS